jgi:hypothetical protein
MRGIFGMGRAGTQGAGQGFLKKRYNMEGISIAEKDHSVVVTFDTDVIDRWQIEQALSLLELGSRNDTHIPDMDPEEQAEIAAHLSSMTPEERKYTVVREG